MERYYVASNEDVPERIYFNFDAMINHVKAGDHDFIDSFDEEGRHVKGFAIIRINGEFVSLDEEF